MRDLRHLIRTCDEVVVAVDDDLRVVSCDGPVERLWGIAPADMLGLPIPTVASRVTLFTTDGTPLAADQVPTARARAEGSAQVHPLLGVQPDGGELRWAHVVASPTPATSDGRPGVVTVWTDLTAIVERDPTDDHVRERTALLEATIAELEAFSYSAAHDLRAPTRAIGTMVDSLLEASGTRLDADSLELLDAIRGTATRMDALTAVLLELASVSRAEPRRAPLDLTALARAELADLRAAHPERAVKTVVARGLHADADESLVRTVLHNLLGNAWKFTSLRAGARIEVGATREAGECVFFVRDNGIGFDPADAERLFLPFERMHAGAGFEGTGVGLATVRRVVARHGGRVWAEGVPGRGATFRFTLAPGASRCSLLTDGPQR